MQHHFIFKEQRIVKKADNKSEVTSCFIYVK